MTRCVFVDTAAWLARITPREAGHGAVATALDEAPGRLVTTNFVLDEVVTLTRMRYGHAAAVRVADALTDSGIADLHRVSADDERDALALFRERPDQRYSFTDCTSFVVMRRLGIDTVLTLDDDFRREGFRVVP